VAQIKSSAADHICHERIARHEIALGQGRCERVKIGGVALTGATLWKLVLDRPHHSTPRIARRAVRLVRKPPATRAPTQELQQPEVGAFATSRPPAPHWMITQARMEAAIDRWSSLTEPIEWFLICGAPTLLAGRLNAAYEAPASESTEHTSASAASALRRR
jgi:hypothetical protein